MLAYRQNGGAPNAPGWDVRVVPNKFPALQVEGRLDREGEGLFDRMNGIGAHEVIIETPDHDKTLATMSRAGDRAGAVGVPRARARSEAGSAASATSWSSRTTAPRPGATLEHSHSQLIALPIVPDFVREEIEGAQAALRGEGALRLLRHHPAGARRPAGG